MDAGTSPRQKKWPILGWRASHQSPATASRSAQTGLVRGGLALAETSKKQIGGLQLFLLPSLNAAGSGRQARGKAR